MVLWAKTWVWAWAAVWACVGAEEPIASKNDKLLYIMMDGLRWDYVDQQKASVLPGFHRILREGVRAKWTNPVFPVLSYPGWTTLATGRYAENHNIVGNYFYDANAKDNFSLFDAHATGKQKWWTSEPVWITAEKAGLRTAQFLWSRCDVPFDGVTTEFCERFVKIPGKEIFETNIQRALEKFDEGFDFVQVYTEHTDYMGHNYGPDSDEVKQAMRDLDDVLLQLMAGLQERELLDKVNIVIVSDHGMTNTAPGTVKRHEIDDYLNPSLVENLADKGAFMNIKALPGNADQVFVQVSRISGVKAYKHTDIPDRYHYRDSPYIHDIILVAEMGNYIMGSHSAKQLPPRDDRFVAIGAHGFDPDVQDMKGIFFARGPAFKCGMTVEPIHIVDVYQVITHILQLAPQPHNGTWAAVYPIFRTDAYTTCTATTTTATTWTLPLVVMVVVSVLARPWHL